MYGYLSFKVYNSVRFVWLEMNLWALKSFLPQENGHPRAWASVSWRTGTSSRYPFCVLSTSVLCRSTHMETKFMYIQIIVERKLVLNCFNWAWRLQGNKDQKVTANAEISNVCDKVLLFTPGNVVLVLWHHL